MSTRRQTRAVQPARFRVALVGCGRIASVHAEALRAVHDATLVACCDLDKAAAEAFATVHGITFAFADIEQMLSDCKPDVVHVLTPPQTHRVLVEACARHRAHVYVEKPLASSEADARAILQCAAAARIHICPGHNRLFDPPFLELRRRVRIGEIGRVLSVRAEQGFGYDAEARAAKIPWSYTYDWGIYEDLMPHPLYLVTHFLTQPGAPLVASFDLDRVREAAVEEIRVLIPSKSAIGEVMFSMNAQPQRARLEVVGTRGSMTADHLGLYTTRALVSRMPTIVQRLAAGFHASIQHAAGSTALVAGALTGRIKPYMGMRTLVGEFYRALREGISPPVDAQDALLTVRLIEQIRTALADKEKRRVAVGHYSSPAHVLVTGASGFLGGRLIERLAEVGVPVRATTRIGSRARRIEGVDWIRCNLASEDELRQAVTGIETVFHCAAMAGPPGSLAEYEEANLHGTLRVAKIAEEKGVQTLVYVSSLSVYARPPRGVKYVDESASYDGRARERGEYTQSKLSAERALLEHARAHPRLRIIVLRPGLLYGPGAPLPIGCLELPSPSRRRPLVAGSPKTPMPLAFVDNVIDAMLAVQTSDVPSGSVFNLVDDPECTQGWVADHIAEVTEGRLRPRFVPYPIVWALMLGVDVVTWARRGKFGTARYRLSRTLADMRYPCLAAREKLKWTPRVSASEGLTRVLAAMNEMPYPHR